MTDLFEPITLRGITARNRVWMSPMCQYSSVDGMPSDWHVVHLGSRATGGVGVAMAEATAVTAEGRITPGDTGIWNDDQVAAWRRVTDVVRAQGAVPALQLAHAGRKASTWVPWQGQGYAEPSSGGWQTIGPSALPYEGLPAPLAMSTADIAALVDAFRDAAVRARDAGFDMVEVHAAHGYLLHEFLSPLSNDRDDEYGGSLEGRMRAVLEVTTAVRKAWPDHLPLLVRISATDWVEGGWDIEQSVVLCQRLREIGVDLVDVSSAGLDARQQVSVQDGYQVPFARRIRQDAGIATGAVGMIRTPEAAQEVIASGSADVVLLGRPLLTDPQWALHAAARLGVEVPWPVQYLRGKDTPLP